MEAKLLAVKRELSADYKRRLDALEAEWAAHSQARTQELESTNALKLQQVRGLWHSTCNGACCAEFVWTPVAGACDARDCNLVSVQHLCR
jgi:hypothetical protein